MKTMKTRNWLAVSLMVVLAGLCEGCVGKAGSGVSVEKDGPIGIADPSNSHSTTVLGEGTTASTGPMAQETSQISKGKLMETNGGGALKGRVSFAVGDLQSMLSVAADIDARNVSGTFKDGKLTSFRIGQLKTDASALQKAVNDGIAAVVAAWTRASDNERAVMEKQLDTQARAGDTVAQGALAIITRMKGL